LGYVEIKMDLSALYERVTELKMRLLFEEPCPIYESDSEEDWEDFWYKEDKYQ
jgi:hypothetical protein